jgi:hypothetical protein
MEAVVVVLMMPLTVLGLMEEGMVEIRMCLQLAELQTVAVVAVLPELKTPTQVVLAALALSS